MKKQNKQPIDGEGKLVEIGKCYFAPLGMGVKYKILYFKNDEIIMRTENSNKEHRIKMKGFQKYYIRTSK